MKIIEFLGKSKVGKTFLFKKIDIKYPEKNLFTYKIIFYFYLFKNKKDIEKFAQ